jgi:hypothetical protein
LELHVRRPGNRSECIRQEHAPFELEGLRFEFAGPAMHRGNPSQQHRAGSPAAPLTRDVCATYIDRGRPKLEENEKFKVTRPLFWPRVSRRRGFLALLGALPTAHGRLGVRPTRRRRIGVLSWAQGIAPNVARVGSTKAPLREAAVVGDHRSDGRCLEASGSSQAERAHLNQHSQPSARGCPFAVPWPSCAEAGARFGARSLRVDTK